MAAEESNRPADTDRDGTVAVVEIGSGSIKLLVTDRSGLTGPGSQQARAAVATRLTPDTGGRISAPALAATAEALRSLSAIMAHHRPRAVTVVGTAATRAASNLAELEALVDETFDVPLQVLSGECEARLAFAGAVAGRQLTGPVSVIDIGSGSTEFATARPDGTIGACSLPVGARILTELYLRSDPHRPDELSSALTVMGLHLDDLRRQLPDLQESIDGGTMIGVGATVQIGAVEAGVDGSVDGYRLAKPAVEEVFRALATESAEQRSFNPGLRPEHVEDIVGAMCVLVGFVRSYAVDEVMISERGLLSGLAAELLAER